MNILAPLEQLKLIFDENIKNNGEAGVGHAESIRLFHGRGNRYPGLEHLCIDWFKPVLLITLFRKKYREAPHSGSVEAPSQELDQESAEAEETLTFITALKNLLLEYQTDLGFEHIVVQDRSGKVSSNKQIVGELSGDYFARENGLKFNIDLETRQNVGFFLDMQHARQCLAEQCEGKRVLNLFSFTCAFSVVALANGAKSVINLDMGKGVLDRGRDNHRLNELDVSKVTFIKSDVFKTWKKLHKYGRYDIIIIDPPSFQKGSFNINKDYAKVVKRLSKLLAPEARILACLNSPFESEVFLDDLFLSDLLPGCTKVQRLPQMESFQDIDPDAALKVVVYQYTRPKDLGNDSKSDRGDEINNGR